MKKEKRKEKNRKYEMNKMTDKKINETRIKKKCTNPIHRSRWHLPSSKTNPPVDYSAIAIIVDHVEV